MLKITKKEVREFLKECREPHPFGWSVDRCGAFIYNSNIELFVAYQGQGINEIVYSEKYDDIVEFENLCDTNEYSLKDATDIAYDHILDMIEENNN